MVTRIILILAGAVLLGILAVGCGGSAGSDSGSEGPVSEAGGQPAIVVTYPILGSLVAELVGDLATVEVLIRNGVDPHDWQPSARDVEAIGEADLVIANGLDLEEGLQDALAEAEGAGVPVFYASDHVDLRTLGEGEGAADEIAENAGGHDDGVGADDPHIWTDPLAMKSVVGGLAAVLQRDLGLPVSGRAGDLETRLDGLDATVRQTLSAIPADSRKLVTGHESMGYFADRYDFEQAGAVVPSISTQAEASAGELADLTARIEEADITVLFTEVGTPSAVVDAIADETGATIVELPSHSLPDDGSYFTFVQEIADAVASALRR